MTPAERIAAIRKRLDDYDPRRTRDTVGNMWAIRTLERHAPEDLAWLADLAERYEKALREIQTCGPQRFPEPELAANEMLYLAREALADDEDTD